MDRDPGWVLPLPRAWRRARGRDRRMSCPRPALVAVRRGRRDRRGHRPGPHAGRLRPPGAAGGHSRMAKRRPHRRRRRARLLAAETEKGMNDGRLLEAARAGDEDAFARLVEPHRRALHAHCYRMLGSVADAEDALQEALLNAWRGLAKFEGRSSLRSWLYTIATNACLRAIERRPKRVLPIDYAPAADPHDGLAEPLVESVWVEPYPDETLAFEDGLAGPEARYEQRESIELAFIAALQHLSARQRAVLILRDVLGFSAREGGETLETTPTGVDSALPPGDGGGGE